MKRLLPIMGLIIGIVVGAVLPINLPVAYSKYMAVAILAALDSVFGGLSAALQKKFDMQIFLTGFSGNALLAAGLAYLGDRLGVDLYLAAIFAFGNRLLLNFAIIRRCLLNKYANKDNI